MPTPRKRVTFPTPIRKTNKKIPPPSKKQTKVQKKPKPQASIINEPANPIPSTTEISYKSDDPYLLSMENTRRTEQQLIKHYIEENTMLRSNSSIGLIKNFLGLEIVPIKQNTHEFYWRNDDKMLSFSLEEIDDVFYYEYLGAENVVLPDALICCINFEKDQLLKFFLNMFEILLAKYK